MTSAVGSDAASLSLTLQCSHGFVCFKGCYDDTLEPRCTRTACISDARVWYEQHMRDIGAPPGHPVLSERWQEAGVSAAVGRVCFVVGSGEQIEYEVGSAVSHDLSKGFVAGSLRAVVGGVEKGGGEVEVSAADMQANAILLDLSKAEWAAYVAELPSLGGTADCGVFLELAAGRKRVDVRSYTTLFKHADGSTSRV